MAVVIAGVGFGFAPPQGSGRSNRVASLETSRTAKTPKPPRRGKDWWMMDWWMGEA